MKASGLGLALDPRLIEIDPDGLDVKTLPAGIGQPRDYRLVAQDLLDEFSLSACVNGRGIRRIEVAVTWLEPEAAVRLIF